MKQITVLLAEHETIGREGIRKMPEPEDGREGAGEAQDGRKSVAQAKKLRPGVVLMDVGMPLLNGLEAAREVLQTAPDTKVLILSAHSDDPYVKNAIASGAVRFQLKQSWPHDVCRTIGKAQIGKPFFSSSFSRHLKPLHPQFHDRTGASDMKSDQLTSREMEVLQLVAEGKVNKQTAAELGISIKTVEKHRDHLMKKLDIHNTAGLTRYAMSEGFIESDVALTAVLADASSEQTENKQRKDGYVNHSQSTKKLWIGEP